MHHPWRAFRALVDWTLRWSHDLPEDRVGQTDHDARTVTLAHGLTQAERRCTIAHEAEHIHAGDVPDWLWPREERRIDDVVSRRLIPLGPLVEALMWSLDEHEIAEELWVDVDTVRARLANLTAKETRWINERLDAGELEQPVF